MASLPAALGRRPRVAVKMELAGGRGADLSLGDSWAQDTGRRTCLAEVEGSAQCKLHKSVQMA